MTIATRLLGVLFVGLLVTACSGTKTTESWLDQNYKGQVKNVYLIGIAKNETNRMIFEDAFEKHLVSEGVKAVSSYKDLPQNHETDPEAIKQRMRTNDCDSVLLTRIVGKRTVASISGGGGYSSASGGFVAVTRPNYYNNWDSYYTYSRSAYISPPLESVDIVLLTVESVLYDLHTEKLIWSAQLETYLEGNIEKMIQLFVGEVTKDLKGKGLI